MQATVEDQKALEEYKKQLFRMKEVRVEAVNASDKNNEFHAIWFCNLAQVIN
jgi:hypothetical protein